MSIEGFNNSESSLERDPEMLNLVRKQMQMALAFSHLPVGKSHEEEQRIMIERLEKNSPKFNIVFDEMLANNPNLLEDWQENSHEILATIEEQMKLIPDFPNKDNEENLKKMSEGGGQEKVA